MQRRKFMALFGGTVLLPRATLAQQAKLPVVGVIDSLAPEASGPLYAAIRQGLGAMGYAEGRNVMIESGSSDPNDDRLPALAADLARRHVNVIVGGGTPASLAAKAATKTIPVVFTASADPVRLGLVANLNRPGGNVTGVTFLMNTIGAKRLELLRELFPAATAIGFLANPASAGSQAELDDVRDAARTLNLTIVARNAANERELDAAFESFAAERVAALMTSADPFFLGRAEQLVALAARAALPTMFHTREFAALGGLVSYGASIPDAFRLAGEYAGRILKGDKPGDLPVQQSAKIELVINLKTAKTLGLTIPMSLFSRADEVIE